MNQHRFLRYERLKGALFAIAGIMEKYPEAVLHDDLKLYELYLLEYELTSPLLSLADIHKRIKRNEILPMAEVVRMRKFIEKDRGERKQSTIRKTHEKNSNSGTIRPPAFRMQ